MLRHVARTVLLIASVCALVLGAPTVAFAQIPLPPTDWTVRSTFIGEDGEDIPLRIGRHDAPTKDGFGYRHIIDGHDELPDERDIGTVLGRSNSLCKYFSQDDRYRCTFQMGDRAIFVVFSERVDPEAPDGRPVGIITAYYSPRGCPC